MYSQGDKVVIRKDLRVGEWYGNIQWWHMDEFLKEKDFVVIDTVDEDGDYIVDGQCVSDEMISHKYEDKKRYVWYFQDRDATYFLEQNSLVKASSTFYLDKVFKGEVEKALLTEEEARQSLFFNTLKKYTPQNELLYYVCAVGEPGDMYVNYSIAHGVYFFGGKFEDSNHRTKFKEEEANRLIGSSPLLFKEKAE